MTESTRVPSAAPVNRQAGTDDGDLRSFFDNAAEGMFRKTRHGVFILVNKALATIFGYSSPGIMLRDFPADRENILLDAPRFLTMLEHLKAHGEIRDFELQFRRKDGVLIWTLINARAVYTTKGSIKHYEGSIVDITERKEADFQRSFIEEQVQQSQKMEAMSILAGGMAADFGTHISPIIHHAESALRNLPENSAVRYDLDRILGSANRAQALIHQFLAISRQRDGEKRPMAMTPVVTETLDDFLDTLPESITLEEDLATKPDTVLADPAQIRQVLENLLDNARNAMPEGGTIIVSMRHVELDEKTAAFRADLAPGSYLRLTVQDTGCGITDEVRTRIFDPFFTTRHSEESQGLGLSVAHGIARAHDGGITVLSEPGLGSTFCLYLPSHAREVDQTQPLAPAPRIGSEKLLIVDTEARELRKWRGLLSPLGYRLKTVSASVEALRTFMEDTSGFDMVVTSYNLPQINGLELARTILGIRADIPVVLCRDASDPVTPDMAQRSGIETILRKPVESQAVIKLLEEALDARKK